VSYRELTMIEVREVLRRWQAGQKVRAITRETGVDRKTVRRYIAWAEGCELEPHTPLTDEIVHLVAHGVQNRIAPPPSAARAALAPHRERIAEWLAGTGDHRSLRLTKVHQLLARQGVSVTYATLRRFAIDELDWTKPKVTVRVDDPPPGHEAQVDFGCMGWMRDPHTGRRRKLWVLVVTLSHSRHLFVWPTFEQTTAAVCEGLDAAWRFFGGVPLRIVPDNTKAIVDHADPTAPRLVSAFGEYAQLRNLFVDTARVRRPKDKPRVENQVAYVRESWFDGETFPDLADARRSAEHWCREIAGTRVHGTTRRVPREVYEQHEKPHMQPPPMEPFDLPLWTDAKVHPDHHVQVQRALYSVPTRYIGRTVRVRSDSRLVRIYVGTELIKTHARVAAGERETDPNDYPPGKADYALRSVDALVARARAQGPHVGGFAERLLDRPLPWTVMRQGYRLLSLCKRYGADRVDALCERALAFEVLDVHRIARMLQSAQRIEDEAESRGQLRKLPAAPRFARPTESFSVRAKGEEGNR
jgi:transposase